MGHDIADLLPGFTYGSDDTTSLEAPPVQDAPPPPEPAPVSATRQVTEAFRYAFTVFRAAAKARKARDDSFFGEFCRSKQPSVDEQIGYAHGRSWVRPGLEHGFTDKAGTWYQRLVGIPMVGLGNAWIAFWKRGIRVLVAVTVSVPIITSIAVWWTATH